MKKKLYFTALLFGLTLFSTSCEDGQKNFTDEFGTILYLNKTGVIDLSFYNTGKDGSFSTSICKSGHDIAGQADVFLSTLSAEELKAYNASSGADFKLLPEKYYTMPTERFIFTPTDSYKIFDVTFKTEAIEEELSATDTYVLPIRLNSANDSINSNLNLLILKPSIQTPELVMEKTGKHSVQLSTLSAPTSLFSIPIYLDVDNEWNFSCVFEKNEEKLTAAVQEFNQSSGTNYTLLPATGYRFDERLPFTPDLLINQLDITLDRTSLQNGDYLLPILMTECEGKPFLTGGSCYIQLKVTDRIIASMMYVNSVSPWDSWERLIDGDVTTQWQSIWHTAEANHDPIYGVYFDITLGYDVTQVAFEYTTSKSATHPTHIKLYAGSDAEHLTEFGELTQAVDKLPIDKQKVFSTRQYRVPTAKFFRFAIVEARQNDGSFKPLTLKNTDAASMGEFNIKVAN